MGGFLIAGKTPGDLPLLIPTCFVVEHLLKAIEDILPFEAAHLMLGNYYSTCIQLFPSSLSFCHFQQWLLLHLGLSSKRNYDTTQAQACRGVTMNPFKLPKPAYVQLRNEGSSYAYLNVSFLLCRNI